MLEMKPVSHGPRSVGFISAMMFVFKALSSADLIRLANMLGVEPAAMLAAVEVETRGRGGFAAGGRIIILFEPHIFSRMTGRRFDDTHPNVSYRAWNPAAYPRTQEERWRQLEEAYALDPEAALSATSWGRTQMMGMHHRACGFESVGEFVRFIAKSESNQLESTFAGFIRTNEMADELQRKDWASFTRRYNGSGQVERYSRLLAEAYARIAQRMAAQTAAHRIETPASPAPAGSTTYTNAATQ